MKYIDADKLLAVLERQNTDKKIIQPLIRIIDSLQQEQPSLPDNLDEVAETYVAGQCPAQSSDLYLEYQLEDAFKAGAEWMAGQGYTVDGVVICDKELTRGYKDIVMSIPDELKVDDKVTIQIRKKEEKK